MKKYILVLISFIIANITFGQTDSGLKLISEYNSDITEITDILRFEGIEYLKLKFVGNELKNKSYKLKVKEIWDGKITNESVVADSKNLHLKEFHTINDTIIEIRVIAKTINKNKLKVRFIFPKVTHTREFDAIESMIDDYSFRNLIDESKAEITYNENFYLFAYILPYEQKNGNFAYCDVAKDLENIEKWGEKFGIKHYLLFEMKFE